MRGSPHSAFTFFIQESVMFSYTRSAARLAATVSVAFAAACHEPSAIVTPLSPLASEAKKDAEIVSTVKWNEVARSMVMKYNTNAPATIRLFALLTVSQYNAIVTAE